MLSSLQTPPQVQLHPQFPLSLQNGFQTSCALFTPALPFRTIELEIVLTQLSHSMSKFMEANMSRFASSSSVVVVARSPLCSYCSSKIHPVPLRRPLNTPLSLTNSPARKAIILASTPLPQSPRPLWPIRIPRPLVYSTNLADVDPVQLSELWEKTLKVTREPSKIMKALRHSFMFVIVLAEQESDDLSLSSLPKVVGIGRAVSDGAFIATICDVAVDPEYQKQGIGRRIVKRLVQEVKKKGGPSGFAVFPPPLARRFFWLIGFRSDRKYRLMGYQGKEEKRVTNENVDDGSLVSEIEES